jgi:predicted acylesterase/phospholipase RssA
MLRYRLTILCCVALSHQALLTQLMARIEDGKSTDVQGDACVAMHCAAAIGDNERARTLIEPAGKRPPLIKVDATDSLGRTALHWACFLSMQNSADFLIGKGADPELRASSSLDALWGTGSWDARLRITAEDGSKTLLPAADGSMLGPNPMEVCFQLHASRILVKGSVDIALDRRVEDDFVGASARSPDPAAPEPCLQHLLQHRLALHPCVRRMCTRNPRSPEAPGG